MDFMNVSVFKNNEEVKTDNDSTGMVREIDAQTRLRKSVTAKKREHKTKQLIVPSGIFLRCVAHKNRAEHPVSLSLRFPSGGVSWRFRNKEQLLSISKWAEVKKMNLCYLRDIRGILYIEICRGGRITVDKECLPGVRHMAVLSEKEVIQFWEDRKSA